MRSRLMCLVLGLVVALALSSAASAQTAQTQSKPATAAKGPAPRHDIDGVWFHIGAGTKLNKTAPLTPWGQAQFAGRKTDQVDLVADSDDPLVKCDPEGFPRSVLFEIRGMQFVTAPTKMVQLFQYERVWREIWTDGRALPKGAGSDAPGAPDPRYYGYSVGHWDGDNTFVVDTVGMDGRTWLDDAGHPHSTDLHVEERYTRPDHDNLQLTVKIDDPKAYTEPYIASTVPFTWNPKQEFEEQLCIPSEAQAYMSVIANPAGGKK
jgi:hypothetical protein